MTPYRLGINIMTSGSGLRGLGGASAGMSSFGFSVANTNSHMGRFVNNMRSGSQAASQMGAAVRNAALAVAATGAAIAAGFVNTNRDLENQKLAMTGLLNANLQFADARGKAMTAEGNFQQSINSSSKMLVQLRADAARGAGSTEDRILAFNAMLNGATSEAGADLQRVRNLANQVVTVSKMIPQLAVDNGQAARDAARILEGTAGVDVVLFRTLRAQLGDAETFNKLAAPERLERFQKAMASFSTPEMIAAQANSYDGLMSTLGDYSKLVIQTMGEGLFQRTKGGLQKVVAYFTKNQAQIEGWATKTGDNIGRIFDDAGKFATNTLMPMYARAKPVISSITSFLTGSFRDAIGFVQQNMPLINAVVDLMTANFRDSIAFVTQNMPAIKEAISRAFTQAAPFIMGVIGFLGELRDMVKADLTPIISYFVATFADGMTILNGWFAENQDLVSDAVEGFRGFVKVGSQIVAWGAAFTGLGIGATLAAMAVYVLRVFAGYTRLYDYISKYGVGGLIRDIGASFLMMKNDVLNALDEVLKGFIDMARGLPGADKLFGLDKLSAEITQRQMNRNFETNDAFSPPTQPPAGPTPNIDDAGVKTNPSTVTVAPNVTIHQTIQTSDPQAAAAAANRGVQRAVSRGVDPSKTGVPLTDPGLR